MVADGLRQWAKRHPAALTGILTVVGYGVVLGVFLVPSFQALFPDLSRSTIDLLTHAIAVVNSITIVTLALGWYFIRVGDVEKHRAAMGTSFALIVTFLSIYVPRVAGGGTKRFEGPELVTYAYFVMLAIHILLSILAVPIVLYAIILGLTHTERELRTETPHARVGRIAAGSWLLSLVLGVITYLLLNHVYSYTY
ncbi:DUF420 domain-containing protein [Halopenitus persicus]|uniref:DUF420 domain-containing protein n=1 Tax=Halopenitus persicus TaxID=1048396 RepID=UPI000BBB4388|nr:DUF420 domain-containing protein [Halopenitus persicus]